jgi:hypothetical protein
MSAATQRNNLDEFIDNLDKMLLPHLAKEIEEESILDAISTCTAPRLLGSDPIRSREECTRLLFRLRNAVPVYWEPMQFKSLSALDKNLDRLLKIGEERATACRVAPVFDMY